MGAIGALAKPGGIVNTANVGHTQDVDAADPTWRIIV